MTNHDAGSSLPARGPAHLLHPRNRVHPNDPCHSVATIRPLCSPANSTRSATIESVWGGGSVAATISKLLGDREAYTPYLRLVSLFRPALTP